MAGSTRHTVFPCLTWMPLSQFSPPPTATLSLSLCSRTHPRHPLSARPEQGSLGRRCCLQGTLPRWPRSGHPNGDCNGRVPNTKWRRNVLARVPTQSRTETQAIWLPHPLLFEHPLARELQSFLHVLYVVRNCRDWGDR